MHWFRLLLVVLCLAGPAVAGEPTPQQRAASYAVVRIKSHGASATVIETSQGRSLLLGCGHAYMGEIRAKPMTVDVQSPNTDGTPKKAAIRLLAVDYQADLSLVELGDGPLAYVAPVAPAGHQPRLAISAGYDDMTWPATVRLATILRTGARDTMTRERPWHGRSGGGLIDAETGYLIGVVSGYTGPKNRQEVYPGSTGVYVSHEAVLRFLQKHASGALDRVPSVPANPCPGGRCPSRPQQLPLPCPQ